MIYMKNRIEDTEIFKNISDKPVYVFYNTHTGIDITEDNVTHIIYIEKSKYDGFDIELENVNISRYIEDYYMKKIGEEYLNIFSITVTNETLFRCYEIENKPKFNEWLTV